MLDSNRMRRTHDNRTEETKQLHIGIGDTFVQVRRRWKTCIVEFNAAPEGNRIPSPKAVELPDFACVTSHRSSVDGASPVPLCAFSYLGKWCGLSNIHGSRLPFSRTFKHSSALHPRMPDRA